MIDFWHPTGFSPLVLAGEYEMGRPPGVAKGSTLWSPIVISLGPLPLETGKHYVWKLFINYQTSEGWELPLQRGQAAGAALLHPGWELLRGLGRHGSGDNPSCKFLLLPQSMSDCPN
jgi:hypothetical protein